MTSSNAINSKKKVVLIDDHEIVRLGLSQIINSDQDFEVVGQCSDAQSGLSMINQHRPDVAVVDINMPGNGAFEMAQVALRQYPSMKIVFLTAHNTDVNVERALASGAAGFVTKSESLTAIVTALREVTAGRAPYLSDDVRARMIVGVKSTSAGAPTVASRKSLLSPREVEVLCCVAQGQSAKQIASVLTISSKTVERHKSNIMAKLNLHTQVDLTRYAIREGIISA
jgi:DNA-binding NarL/FixJ family response regulator